MKHEKILRREGGSKVKIQIRYKTELHSDSSQYHINVSTCAPRKRKWYSFEEPTDWRSLSHIERDKFAMAYFLTIATKEEIMETALELHEKMKPTNTIFKD